MGRVGNRAEVTYSVTSRSRLRRRRGIGRRLPTDRAMAPTASPLFRAAGGVFDEVAAAEAAADVGKLFEGSKEELAKRWEGSAVVFKNDSLGIIPMGCTRAADQINKATVRLIPKPGRLE